MSSYKRLRDGYGVPVHRGLGEYSSSGRAMHSIEFQPLLFIKIEGMPRKDVDWFDFPL